MTMTGPEGERTDDDREYLCVDAFIESVVGAQALATAFQLRLIDSLAGGGWAAGANLAGVCWAWM